MSVARLWDRFRRFTFDHPVISFSLIVGVAGPVMAAVGIPLRRRLGYEPAPELPASYPLPNRRRNPPVGYDD
ncbi:hypothetical protein THASP1DRAFT_29652 [Thamnocephalis sphaerospora]|uniref:NADH-ubiquinone oxidoreductase 9.5 kDa subunit n=1 Tax=Thamnocephalis sphaerospora TaxID=78915 RepID=A0A4P9XSQ6_9FUNG|nr:hypothetical protein THASP1DRAFT_29652 [Thamnocephalis sphaerospora]|eukprot:RKP08541.1 hypothetical protein THASP1DRAFT_29652 [Thamnocephalis sphaerospora]